MKLFPLDRNSIFILDGAGALGSALLTGVALPHFSDWIGIPKSYLYGLALFPIAYLAYSLLCLLLPRRAPWMILGLILANSFYGALSLGVMLTLEGIRPWGIFFLGSEIVVLLGVIALEIGVYRREKRSPLG